MELRTETIEVCVPVDALEVIIDREIVMLNPDVSMEERGESTGSSHQVPLNVEDYIFRGNELDDYSIYELAMASYSCSTDKATMERYHQRDRTTRRGPGSSTIWNQRAFFQSAHSQAESRWTVFQKQEKVPCILGIKTQFKSPRVY